MHEQHGDSEYQTNCWVKQQSDSMSSTWSVLWYMSVTSTMPCESVIICGKEPSHDNTKQWPYNHNWDHTTKQIGTRNKTAQHSTQHKTKRHYCKYYKFLRSIASECGVRWHDEVARNKQQQQQWASESAGSDGANGRHFWIFEIRSSI